MVKECDLFEGYIWPLPRDTEENPVCVAVADCSPSFRGSRYEHPVTVCQAGRAGLPVTLGSKNSTVGSPGFAGR